MQLLAKKVILVVALILLFGTRGLAQPTGAADAPTAEAKTIASLSLQGVWRISEAATRSPGAEWTNITPTQSLYIFTATHFSYMFTIGRGQRQTFAGDPNAPTDAEKVAAYDSIVAASGTYILSGSTLSFTPLLHKNPNEMVGHTVEYTIILAETTATLTTFSPPFAPGRERRIVLTRVE